MPRVTRNYDYDLVVGEQEYNVYREREKKREHFIMVTAKKRNKMMQL